MLNTQESLVKDFWSPHLPIFRRVLWLAPPIYKKPTVFKRRLSAFSVFPINDSARVQLFVFSQFSHMTNTILIMGISDVHHKIISGRLYRHINTRNFVSLEFRQALSYSLRKNCKINYKCNFYVNINAHNPKCVSSSILWQRYLFLVLPWVVLLNLKTKF